MTSPATFITHLLISLPLKMALQVSCTATAIGMAAVAVVFWDEEAALEVEVTSLVDGPVCPVLLVLLPLKLTGLVLVDRDEATLAVANGDDVWFSNRSPPLLPLVPSGGLALRRRDDPLPLLGAAWGGGKIPLKPASDWSGFDDADAPPSFGNLELIFGLDPADLLVTAPSPSACC